jgi:DNA-binding CsgD family transcriptional regulator
MITFTLPNTATQPSLYRHHTKGSTMQQEKERAHNPGILAVTATLETLYMNHEAQEFSRHLNRADGSVQPGTLPLDVVKVCNEILGRLKDPRDLRDLEQVHVRHVTGGPRPLLLQGFSLPTSNSIESSLIIVLMEETEIEDGMEIREAQIRFNLTEREVNVAEHLAKGLTNKEIALTLSITEQTVKQHLKHMMVKTQSSTRTGVLAQLLGASRHVPGSAASNSLRQAS